MSTHADYRSVYIRTRTQVPRSPAELMDRPRLMDMLSEAQRARLVVIQAPAGYGKTSLLLQWCERLTANRARVAWFTPDPADRDPELFLGYLVRALEEAGHTVSDTLRALITTESFYTWQVLATHLANDLADIGGPLYLFIDDLQNLRASEALECLRYLIESTPADLHFILSSREDPGIPLGRLRVVDSVFELRAQDLRFAPHETACYFAARGHERLSDERLAAVESRTEGWIVGLKLLSMAMHWHGDEPIPNTAFGGEQREIADFFAEDVLARQSHEVQEFLLKTCVLERLCPALCDSLPGVLGSRRLLDLCDANGLFLIALDETRTWYRYHSLFADFLRRQLSDRYPGLADELYVAASRWLEASGFHTEAFDYALRGSNPIRAAEILDAQCEAMWSAGRQQVVQSLAERLPPHVQALYPRIMLSLAWRLVACWKIDQAQQLVAVCKARLAQMSPQSEDDALVRSLRSRIIHRESQIAMHLYQLDTVERLSRELLEENHGADDDPYLKASILATLQYAQREQFQLDNVYRTIEQARVAMQQTGFSHGMVFHSALAAPTYLLAGRVQEAGRMLTDGLKIACELTGRGSSLGAIVALHLAQLMYEINDIEGCSQLMEEYFRPDEPVGIADQLVAGWITQSRLDRVRGDFESAIQRLNEAVDFAARHSVTRLRMVATAEYVRVLLRIGRPDDAAHYAKRAGLTRKLDQTSRSRLTTADSAQALAWCRLWASQDKITDALVVARRWRAHVTTAEAVHAAVEWGVLVAELLLLSGDRKAAQRALGQAVALAAPAQFSRAFLDEGEPIALLLERMIGGEYNPQGATDHFMRKLVADFGGHRAKPVDEPPPVQLDKSALVGRLSSRELEILTLAGAGVLNKRISEKLGLTEGTVKWYLQQVFDKLGVRDRARAAVKARQLGLIG